MGLLLDFSRVFALFFVNFFMELWGMGHRQVSNRYFSILALASLGRTPLSGFCVPRNKIRGKLGVVGRRLP